MPLFKTHARRPLFFLLVCCAFCSAVSAQTYDCFEILSNSNNNIAFSGFDRTINVLDVMTIYGEPGVSDTQLLHVASIAAELLDNDEDGLVDHAGLAAELSASQSFMPVFSQEGSNAEEQLFEYFSDELFCASAVLYADEVSPENPVDWFEEATLEELLHTVNHCGHVALFPEAFSLEPNSSLLSDAMDVARGGQFTSIPGSYPASAWYHYDDATCDYQCMAIEYLYWATASAMGVLDDPSICAAIDEEWELCSPALFEDGDVLASALIHSPAYGIPLSAPNGQYCTELSTVNPIELGSKPNIRAWSPASGCLSVVIEGNCQTGSISKPLIQVFDAAGAQVASSLSTTLSLQNLPGGMFLVQFGKGETLKVKVL
jgi:hypothetical protein